MPSSGTPLLGGGNYKDEHPIFLRVCHAPWTTIGQRQLVAIRGIIAAYLVVSSAYLLDYDLNKLNAGWGAAFELGNIAYAAQTVYFLITAVWAFMHLYYPDGSPEQSNYENPSTWHKYFSPPRQSEDSNSRYSFSLFYTSALVYPFVVTFIHWAVLVPKGESEIPGDMSFGNGQDTEFFVTAKYIVNSVIAFTEVYFLSSIKRQTPLNGHIIGLTILSAAYIAWAYFGYVVTDNYSYFFLDHEKLGAEYVLGAIVAFIGLTDVLFAFTYGITGVRESSTTKCDNRQGYARLPQ